MMLFNFYNLLNCYNLNDNVFISFNSGKKIYPVDKIEIDNREYILYIFTTKYQNQKTLTIKEIKNQINNLDKRFYINYNKQIMILDYSGESFYITDIERAYNGIYLTTRKYYTEIGDNKK